jgi:hypothetical protein
MFLEVVPAPRPVPYLAYSRARADGHISVIICSLNLRAPCFEYSVYTIIVVPSAYKYAQYCICAVYRPVITRTAFMLSSAVGTPINIHYARSLSRTPHVLPFRLLILFYRNPLNTKYRRVEHTLLSIWITYAL